MFWFDVFAVDMSSGRHYRASVLCVHGGIGDGKARRHGIQSQRLAYVAFLPFPAPIMFYVYFMAAQATGVSLI